MNQETKDLITLWLIMIGTMAIPFIIWGIAILIKGFADTLYHQMFVYP